MIGFKNAFKVRVCRKMKKNQPSRLNDDKGAHPSKTVRIENNAMPGTEGGKGTASRPVARQRLLGPVLRRHRVGSQPMKEERAELEIGVGQHALSSESGNGGAIEATEEDEKKRQRRRPGQRKTGSLTCYLQAMNDLTEAHLISPS